MGGTERPTLTEYREEFPTPASSTSFPGLSVEKVYMGRLVYFPPGAFSTNERLNQFVDEWYGIHLAAMNEVSLYMGGEEEGYRFLWLRSDHAPVAVHLRTAGERRLVTVKQLSWGGYRPGKLAVNRSRTLSRGEWDQFIALTESAGYWRLPAEGDEAGAAGARWVLEGVKGGRYHVVDRGGPESGYYREACLYVLKLSGLWIGSEEVY